MPDDMIQTEASWLTTLGRRSTMCMRSSTSIGGQNTLSYALPYKLASSLHYVFTLREEGRWLCGPNSNNIIVNLQIHSLIIIKHTISY